MGVKDNEELVTHMVVISIETNKVSERYHPGQNQVTCERYFKQFTHASDVIEKVASLKDNEKIQNIFTVDEFGVTKNMNVVFDGGKLQLKPTTPEEEISI